MKHKLWLEVSSFRVLTCRRCSFVQRELGGSTNIRSQPFAFIQHDESLSALKNDTPEDHHVSGLDYANVRLALMYPVP